MSPVPLLTAPGSTISRFALPIKAERIFILPTNRLLAHVNASSCVAKCDTLYNTGYGELMLTKHPGAPATTLYCVPWSASVVRIDCRVNCAVQAQAIVEARQERSKLSTNPSIPILDLKEQYKQIGPALENKVIEILRSGNYILGKYVSELEDEVAAFCGVEFGVAVANGTDALILAIWALDLSPGDEIITPPFTFAATAEAIAVRGATPVFVDVEEDTFNMNVSRIEAAITNRTKAILPVHLYGQAANMEQIRALADSYGLKIIEDNAQAIGASHKGRPTGSFGDMACISFYPTKNLGAAGDAGMIVTNNEQLMQRLRKLRAHGSAVRYFHDEVGVNSRLDEIQAAVLLSKLPFLRQWNSQRNTVARWYEECLRHTPGLILPKVAPGNVHVWHQYTVRVNGGNQLADEELRTHLSRELQRREIGSMCYYPVPLHLQKAFASDRYKRGDFPVSERLASQVLSLPMYPELAYGQVARIGREINTIMAERMATGSYNAAHVPSGL